VVGIEMVRAMRHNLIAQGLENLSLPISEITGATVSRLYTDIDTHMGERVIVFSLDQDLESFFP
jgi:uncharacterized protein YbcI